MTHNTQHTVPSHSDIATRIQAAIAAHPPMPAMFQELLQHINDPDIEYHQLADKVRYDPGITMNILKVVNSAAFAGAQRIESLQQAFVRLGAKKLFRIIIAQGVAAQLADKLEGYDLDPHILLKHSIGVAVTAETLARSLGRHPKEMLFTAGLLHDMGKVILDPFVREYRGQFDESLHETDASFDAIERDILGITHPQAGALLMEKWTFPKELVAMVQHHHHPDDAAEHQEAILIVHVADTLVYSLGVGAGIDGFRYTVSEHAAATLGLQSKHIEQIASRTWETLTTWNAII